MEYNQREVEELLEKTIPKRIFYNKNRNKIKPETHYSPKKKTISPSNHLDPIRY